MGQKINPILFRSGLKRKQVFPRTRPLFLFSKKAKEETPWPLKLLSRPAIANRSKSLATNRLLKKKETPSLSFSPVQAPHFSHFLVQEIEGKKFLSSLLQSRGILLRSCDFHRTSEKLTIGLDLYFTSLFYKRSKLFWVRSFFKNLKKKKPQLKKVKDLKQFLDETLALDESLTNYRSPKIRLNYFSRSSSFSKELVKVPKAWKSPKVSKISGGENPKEALVEETAISNQSLIADLKEEKLDSEIEDSFEDLDFVYKRRLFYYLVYRKRKDIFPTECEEDGFGVNQNHFKPGSNFVRTKIRKLYRLFSLRKLRSMYFNFSLKNSIFSRGKKSQSLLKLNQFLCASMQKYFGMEQITLKLTSAQLAFLPTFKMYKRSVLRKLFSFKRNRHLKKYLLETVELLYFVLGTYGKGNASLLAKFIVHLLERNRKQLFVVKFLKKCLQIFFQKFPKSLLSVEGIKILIKGRFNKRRRTKKLLLSEGEISLQTLDTCIDYFQLPAITLYGSFGVKVWISKKKLSA